MAIQRWDPLKDLLQLRQTMNRMFEDVLARSATAGPESGAAAWSPPVDLFEEPRRYVLRADLPGIEVADVDLAVEDGRLVVRGQRRTDGDVARESYLRVERPNGAFTIQVGLPDSVDARQIRAAHRNGVLEIVLPKREDRGGGKIEIATE